MSKEVIDGLFCIQVLASTVTLACHVNPCNPVFFMCFVRVDQFLTNTTAEEFPKVTVNGH